VGTPVVVSDLTPEEPSAKRHDTLPEGKDAEDIANEELPLDPAGPTELGGAVDE
jgi:hypothetical protein